MKTIILLCGGKCSGKTTGATAIYAFQMVAKGCIPNANLSETGQLSIVYDKEKNEGIIFDIDSNDPEFLDFKNRQTSRFINHVGFADELKRTASQLFGLDYSKLTGSNDQKNEFCHIKWVDMNKLLPNNKKKKNAPEFMTNRQFLEVLGTDICRVIYGDCHIQSAYKKLMALAPEIGIVPDCRFTNEFEFFEKLTDVEVIKIKFARNVHASEAESENGLVGVDDSRYDLVIHNEELSVTEKNNLIINFLIEKEVLSSKNVKVA
jgi:hypothetical protein